MDSVSCTSSDVSRNETIDLVRGVAIWLVMIGHVCQVSASGFESTLLFNVIWAIQMPLFMVVSGYCTRYSCTIDNSKVYFQYLRKRSITYLLPWFVWTFAVKCMLIGGMLSTSYIKYIVYNMDAGYWFLFSLWMICVMYGTASFIANALSKDVVKQVYICLALSALGAGICLGVGFVYGLSFFGIKLTVYYLSFFCLGFLYSRLEERYAGTAWFIVVKQAAVLPVLVLFAAVILRYDLFASVDSVASILIRIIASVSGCVITIMTVAHYCDKMNQKCKNSLLFAGRHSLELYVVHALFIAVIRLKHMPTLMSVEGVLLCVINFLLMFAFTYITIMVILSNTWSRAFVFGRFK